MRCRINKTEAKLVTIATFGFLLIVSSSAAAQSRSIDSRWHEGAVAPVGDFTTANPSVPNLGTTFQGRTSIEAYDRPRTNPWNSLFAKRKTLDDSRYIVLENLPTMSVFGAEQWLRLGKIDENGTVNDPTFWFKFSDDGRVSDEILRLWGASPPVNYSTE